MLIERFVPSRGCKQNFPCMLFEGVISIAAGDLHSLVLKQDGSVWSCGLNVNGQLGIPSITHSTDTFEQTTVSSGAIAIAGGLVHSVALKQDGGVYLAGTEMHEKLKIDDFVHVQSIEGARMVAAGGGHTMVLAQNGSVWAMGWNFIGQIGDGTTTDRSRFVQVISSGGKSLAAGHAHSLVVKMDGSLWVAGWNKMGQLGDGAPWAGAKTDRKYYVQVMGNGAEAVAAGGYHSIVLKRDGTVWTTGWNKHGQLGDGSTDDRDIFHQVSRNAKAVTAGVRHTVVLKRDGSVWSTLFNVDGQLGKHEGENRGIFVQVIPSGAHSVKAGSYHTMVLKEDGTLWAAGSNKFGQIGYSGAYHDSMRNFIQVSLTGNGAIEDAVVA